MINLELISRKLDNIFNGLDSEIDYINNPSPMNERYFFNFYTEGLFLNEIYDPKSRKNFIPVIVGAFGGEFNPIPNLEQQEYNVNIQINFPVRFKEDFYNMNNFLIKTFVGKVLTYGDTKAVSNISVPEFGEITNLDLKEYAKWVQDIWQQPMEAMESYMTMTFTLYLSTAKDLGLANGFVLGNDISVSKVQIYTLNDDNTKNIILEDSEPIFTQHALVSNTEGATQQFLGGDYSRGIPATSGYGFEMPLMVKNNEGYFNLLKKLEGERKVQDLRCDITTKYNIYTTFESTKSYYITNYSRVAMIGSLLTITISLADLEVI